MTKAIAIGSPRKAHAEAFGSELARAMRKRGVGRRPLSAAAKVSESAILNYRGGINLPRHETAIRLAESLQWPSLIDLSLAARSGRCEVDDKPFLNEGGTPKRYCSPECNAVAQKRKHGLNLRQLSVTATRRLVVYRSAVEAFCRSCETDGFCRTPGCELRGVSPLPLLQREVTAEIARPAPNVTPVTLEKHRRRTQQQWLDMSPEQRARRLERMREGRWGPKAASA